MDRASGSGVFARDPDAMLDLIELDVTDDLRKQEQNKTVCATCQTYLDSHFGWEDDLSQDDLCSQVQMMASLSDGKNSTEYSRQYVDEASERSDVVGYAPSMDYEFDLYTNDAVQKKLATITDDELLGSDAQVTIVMVDLFEVKSEDPNTCTARKRDWSVIPDTEGDGTDALIYKGSFKAAGEIIKGTATTTDSWQTCTFTAE